MRVPDPLPNDDELAEIEKTCNEAAQAISGAERILQFRELEQGLRRAITLIREARRQQKLVGHQHVAALIRLRDSMRLLPTNPHPGERQLWSIGNRNTFDDAVRQLREFLDSLGTDHNPPAE